MQTDLNMTAAFYAVWLSSIPNIFPWYPFFSPQNFYVFPTVSLMVLSPSLLSSRIPLLLDLLPFLLFLFNDPAGAIERKFLIGRSYFLGIES